MTRLDRMTLHAVLAPLPGAVAALIAIGWLVALRRLTEVGPISDPSTLLRLGADCALGLLPTVLPPAFGLAAALGWSRLRARGDLEALAAAGASPRRALAAPALVAGLASGALLPVAHAVAPEARARLETEAARLTARDAELRWQQGRPQVLAVGPAGASFVLGPNRVAAVGVRGGALVASADALRFEAAEAIVDLTDVTAWSPRGDRVESAEVTLRGWPTPTPRNPTRPERSWSSERLAEAEASQSRARRLLAERWAAPLNLLAFGLWGIGGALRRKRSDPAAVTALGVASFYALDRMAVALGLGAVAPWVAPCALGAGGLAPILRRERRP